ncbi:hypothetical protein FJ364_05055 [Candidatus Dependentiae bacterium]|nr:hypothetical protein [Candidatus Dependentiae bacterium]
MIKKIQIAVLAWCLLRIGSLCAMTSNEVNNIYTPVSMNYIMLHPSIDVNRNIFNNRPYGGELIWLYSYYFAQHVLDFSNGDIDLFQDPVFQSGLGYQFPYSHFQRWLLRSLTPNNDRDFKRNEIAMNARTMYNVHGIIPLMYDRFTNRDDFKTIFENKNNLNILSRKMYCAASCDELLNSFYRVAHKDKIDGNSLTAREKKRDLLLKKALIRIRQFNNFSFVIILNVNEPNMEHHDICIVVRALIKNAQPCYELFLWDPLMYEDERYQHLLFAIHHYIEQFRIQENVLKIKNRFKKKIHEIKEDFNNDVSFGRFSRLESKVKQVYQEMLTVGLPDPEGYLKSLRADTV